MTKTPPRFQIQAWRADQVCTCRELQADRASHEPRCAYPNATHSWVPMEDGAAAARWKPKSSAVEAVKLAAAWSGAVYGISIPAMQVLDLTTGDVIWRASALQPDAGDSIAPYWQPRLYAQVRDELAAQERAS